MHYDLVVVGGGSGGVRAARLVAQSGHRVALVEDGMMGGTCVNLGCVPKKFYVNASGFPHYQHLAQDYGWDMPKGTFSLDRLRQAKDAQIQRLQHIYRSNAEKAGVEVIDGWGTFIASDCLRVGERDITADRFLIATGTTSTMPSQFPGIELAHNSDAVFSLQQVPKRSIVYGGGYIAVELAGMLARMGSDVALVYRGPRLLKNFDPDLTAALEPLLEHDGVRLHLETQLTGLTQLSSAVAATTSRGDVLEAEFVLFALGRHANIGGLGLATRCASHNDGALASSQGDALQLTPQGFIEVDANYRTSIDGIYAIGDVIGTVQLTPMAIAQAMDFHAKHFAPGSAPAMPRYVPTCVFTQPPLGTVGLGEQQLRQQNRAYHCFRGRFIPLHLSLGKHPQRVHFKILVDQKTDEVLGVHLLSDYAEEIIQSITPALETGLTKAQLDATLAVHPSVAEELVTTYHPSESWSPAPV